MKSIPKLTIFLALTLVCCIDEYPISIPFDGPQLVIDALVSSELNESYVRIGWSYPQEENCYYHSDGEKYPIPCPPDTVSGGTYHVTGRISISDETRTLREYPFRMHDRKRHITIDMHDLTGEPEEKYMLHITVDYEGTTRSYAAETKMHRTPSFTSLSYEVRKGDIGKNDNFVPLVHFTEPREEENYYIFRLCETYWGGGDNMYCGNDRVWPYSVMSDQFLPENVRGLSIDDGATVAKYAEFYPHPQEGAGVQVRMYSADRKVYEFYRDLIHQFNNDGGAYSPTPATPRGNISGGAIGIFRATHESRGEVYY